MHRIELTKKIWLKAVTVTENETETETETETIHIKSHL